MSSARGVGLVLALASAAGLLGSCRLRSVTQEVVDTEGHHFSLECGQLNPGDEPLMCHEAKPLFPFERKKPDEGFLYGAGGYQVICMGHVIAHGKGGSYAAPNCRAIACHTDGDCAPDGTAPHHCVHGLCATGAPLSERDVNALCLAGKGDQRSVSQALLNQVIAAGNAACRGKSCTLPKDCRRP